MNIAPVFQWTAETPSKPHAKPEKRTPDSRFRHILIRNLPRGSSGAPIGFEDTRQRTPIPQIGRGEVFFASVTLSGSSVNCLPSW